MSGQEQAKNGQAGFGAESSKAIGGTCDLHGVGPAHISIIAEIWKHIKAILRVPEVGLVQSRPFGAVTPNN
jgi:hypothetical protein